MYTRVFSTATVLLLLTVPALAGPKAKPTPPQVVQLYGPANQYSLYVLLENSIPWQFRLDTGASDTFIPWSLMSILWEARLISAANRLPDAEYTMADGRSSTFMRFNITLTIGTHQLDNVIVCVGAKGQPTMSLLGTRVLTRFQSFGINHTTGKLHLGALRPN